MKVLYQPTQATPGDWQECDSKEWGRLGEFTIHALCIQGDIYEGPDHYAVRDVGSGLVSVTVWHDDPTDWPVGTRWARVVTYQPLGPDPRPEYGGAINVRRLLTIYADDEALFQAAYPEADVRPWADFDHSREKAMHGVWVSDEAHEAHQGARLIRGWREWTEGLHPTLVVDGKVRGQRQAGLYKRPKGTRTYYHVDDAAGPVVHGGCAHYNNLYTTTGTSIIENVNVGTAGILCWSATTEANEPDTTPWPTTGVYRAQLDVVAAGADLVFGLLTLDGAQGHFGRVLGDASACVQQVEQDEAAFFGSGLHLATVTDPSWLVGAQTDRYDIVIAGFRVAGHGSQSLQLQVGETDDYTDGPWPGVTPPSDVNPPLFGSHF
jgi:hypothetical protein